MTSMWREDAACRLADAALFDFPGMETVDVLVDRLARARVVCAGCPVADRCITEARRSHDWGVRGGLMFEAGKVVDMPTAVFGRPRQPCGTSAAYKRHQRAGEQPCQPCSVAHAAENTALRSRRRAAAGVVERITERVAS